MATEMRKDGAIYYFYLAHAEAALGEKADADMDGKVACDLDSSYCNK